ncbi:hypothetical protein Plhal304r1_c033g0104931 [Plasmopara halstedii]
MMITVNITVILVTLYTHYQRYVSTEWLGTATKQSCAKDYSKISLTHPSLCILSRMSLLLLCSNRT